MIHRRGEGKFQRFLKGTKGYHKSAAPLMLYCGFALALVLPFSQAHFLYGEEALLTSFGKGEVKVVIYTDYFCPPCRAMEPQIEPILIDLMKKDRIQLTFVDTPIYRHSPLYARYFLYSLKLKKDFHHALWVRNTLFAAAEQQITEKKKLEDFLHQKGVSFLPFDTSSVLEAWNRMLNDDRIDSTPTVVVRQGVKKEVFKGSSDILKALSELR